MTPLSNINIPKLINREQIAFNLESLASYVSGRRVLVTGGAGSIGGELCYQLLKLGATVMCLDNNEGAVFNQLNRYPNNINYSYTLCDVRDFCRTQKVVSEFAPSLVFHAAAYKHVGLMERFASEAIKTNVVGTNNVLLCAQSCNARFVLISTDKAVEPCGVMGASKRLAELITQSNNECVLRLGNVIGSSGSVVPLFLSSIMSNLPITISHIEATRYMVTLYEAAMTAILTASIAETGCIVVPKMGEPVSIFSLAKGLIEQCGKTGEILITFSNLKQGEKREEKLWFYYEIVEENPFYYVLRKSDKYFNYSRTMSEVEHMLKCATDTELKEWLLA